LATFAQVCYFFEFALDLHAEMLQCHPTRGEVMTSSATSYDHPTTFPNNGNCCCRQKLLANAEKKKGMVSDMPFKLCSPMKKSTGPGDFQGTLQGKVEYIAVRAFVYYWHRNRDLT
jgi:hypothetical protein